MANLVIKNNSQSDVSLTLDRGNYANWRMLSSGGILKVQTDWTDKKGNYYNVITLDYNTGNATIKGSVTAPSFIGALTGNAATADKWKTARTIKLTGDVNDVSATFDGTSNISLSLVVKDNSHNHSYIVSRGGVAAETGTNLPAVGGLSMTQAYSNGYPTTYGNVITMRGQGSGQLLIGWSGTSGADAPAYIRSKRDTSDAKWSEWRELITSANIGSQSVSYASSAGVTTRINVRASSYTSSTAGEIWIVA